jgi:hypothetical protein
MLTEHLVDKVQFFQTLRNNLKYLYNRSSKHSILTLSCVFYAFAYQGCVGGNIPPGFDLNNVIDYPETDESISTGIFAATSVKAFLLLIDKTSQQRWVKYFWKRSYELEPCKINYLTDIEP